MINPPTINIGGKQTNAQYQFSLQSTNLQDLYKYTPILQDKLSQIPGLQDVNSDLQIDNPQVNVEINRDRANALGLTSQQIETALGDAYGTLQVSTIYAPDNEYEVILGLSPQYQQDPNALNLLSIHTPNGRLVPLNAVATLTKGVGSLTVNHQGQLPATTISFNLKLGVSLGDVTDKIQQIARDTLPATISTSFQGSAQVFQSSIAGLGLLLLVAIVVIYAHSLGIRTTSMLMPQINAQYVRRNLLASHYYGADIHQHQTQLELVIHTAYQLIYYTLKEGHIPYIIAPGGSSPLGAIAYVNAAFELKEQIVQGQIPEPDFIYLPLGTMGTAVGLVLGLKAVGLKTKVIGVRVVEAQFANEKKMVNLLNHTNSLLQSLDPTFPTLKITGNDFSIRQQFFGKEYAQFTESGLEAIALMNDYEHISLDGTYTGKAFAALVHDIRQENIKRKVILFWNTYNSRNLPSPSIGKDFYQLPQALHRYFIDNVQPLDYAFSTNLCKKAG
ncbi:1-aminocyclopropane-1-carboxylate deaminase/D-cysteine desulfhydrase [Nostoc sp. MS1]|uniref:1-aminocyclopropane-1-carboxylate deaminase/D-cysteine desulfhydrase n=1 Tax=Nostoc sp. MS1 TaxID=2764711 RepID=UPI0021E11241|nr:efflux RND transporter permease subunit [Nostoc sp. MS1]BCL33919.1 hypothetical protein NSMS1_03660 [Nostoc sp. MS1]